VVALNKEHGLTMRTTCRVLKTLTGLDVSPGGVSQIVSRAARKVRGCYDELIREIRESLAVFADETSWWVGEPGWWLWTFTAARTTVYRVDKSRGSDVVTGVLGQGYKGMMVSDCLSSYDPAPYAKHKCIAHHLRAIKEAKEDPSARDQGYLEEWRGVFLAVNALHKARSDLTQESFAELRGQLEARVEELLGQNKTQACDLRIHKRLSKQRKHLLGCLYEPAAEPTNNRAERALRPAVIARKLSCGNKTPKGKDAWQILASLAVTCRQRSESFVNFLASRLPLQATAAG
jgi:hypothetical protein